MARISIEPPRAKGTLTEQSKLEKTLKGLYQEVENVRSGLTFKIAGQEAIAARLRSAAEQIDREAVSVGALRSGLMEVVARYEQTESGNLNRVGAEKTTVQGSDSGNIWSSLLPGMGAVFPNWLWDLLIPLKPSPWPIGSELVKWITAIGASFPPLKFEPKFESEADIDLKEAYEDGDGFFKKLSDFEDANSKDKGIKVYYDTKTKTFIKVDAEDKAALEEFKKHNKGTIPVDLKVAGVGTSGDASLFGLEGEIGLEGIGGAEGSVDLFKLEGETSAYIGMLGIGASAGASFTAFSAEEKAYLGTEDLNVYEKVEVTAGKVGANVGASAGLIDKEGKFNPSAYVGASAEAIAGEVSGSVGVKALGADVAVKGSLNYGVGAHANVGIHDGKISVDVGATLGVGVSVKLDIDVSGTVEAIGDAVGNVASGVAEFFDWITPW